MSFSRGDGCFGYWWTRTEYSNDKRTGALALVEETHCGWSWTVRTLAKTVRGTSTSQKGARAACRRVARKLSNK